MATTLSRLPQGQDGNVTSISTEETLRRRLLDFGLTEGTGVRCLRVCRGMMLLLVRGTMLALRRSDAERISVEVRT